MEKFRGEKKLKIKLRYIFYVFVGVYGLDFITTIINLNFTNGRLIENNPFQAQFFNLGWYGYFLSFFITTSILFLLTLFIGLFGLLVKRIEDKTDSFKYYNFFLTYCCGVFSGFEFIVIINNILLFLRY